MRHWVPTVHAGIDLTRLSLTEEETTLLGRIDGRRSNVDLSAETGLSVQRVQRLLLRLFVQGVIGRNDIHAAGGDLVQLFMEQTAAPERASDRFSDDAVETIQVKPDQRMATAPVVASREQPRSGNESSGFGHHDVARTLPLANYLAIDTTVRRSSAEDAEYEDAAPTVRTSIAKPAVTAVQPVDPALLAACTDWGAAFVSTEPRVSSSVASEARANAPDLGEPASTVVLLTEAIEQPERAPPVTDGGFAAATTTQVAPGTASMPSDASAPVTLPEIKPES